MEPQTLEDIAKGDEIAVVSNGYVEAIHTVTKVNKRSFSCKGFCLGSVHFTKKDGTSSYRISTGKVRVGPWKARRCLPQDREEMDRRRLARTLTDLLQMRDYDGEVPVYFSDMTLPDLQAIYAIVEKYQPKEG